MSLENVKDPYTALFILKWLEQNKQKFFGDIQLTESQVVAIVEKYIEDNKDELKGDDGETPQHRWVGTKLQFKNPDGSWGKLVDLKGARGGTWFSGGGGTDLDSLPVCTNPEGVTEMVVKEDGQWKRLEVQLVIIDNYCKFVTSEGEVVITSDGQQYNVVCNS